MLSNDENRQKELDELIAKIKALLKRTVSDEDAELASYREEKYGK